MQARRLTRCLGFGGLLLPVAGALACTTPEPAGTGRQTVRIDAPPARRLLRRGVAPKTALRFEPEVFRNEPRERFMARARGVSVHLAEDGATMARAPARPGGSVTAVRMRVVGNRDANPLTASAELAGRSNYFIGNDRSKWQTDVPGFARVTIHDVAPGVDQVFHGEDGRLEYDLVVAAGARTDSLELAFDGADAVSLDARGDLRIHAGDSVLLQAKPHLYQRKDGGDVSVAGAYRVTGTAQVAFEVGPYDHAIALVIDPVLAYASYLGGSGDDFGSGVAVDADGAMYVTGFTTSVDFPVEAAFTSSLVGTADVFLTKFSPDGQSLVYSTYLGGSEGAYAYAVAVDGTGAAFVVGATDSPDFPTVKAYQSSIGGDVDAFVVKLGPNGDTLAYATYLGGSQHDYGYGLALDAAGDAFIVGTTDGSFPVTNNAAQGTFGGATDAFVTELSATGSSLVYSTYVGGSQGESGSGIAVDGAGSAYATGYSASLDFPTAPAGASLQPLNAGTENAFVTKLSVDGSYRVYSTYLGGSQTDEGRSIAVDGQGSAYVTGSALSSDFPTTNALQPASNGLGATTNAFIAKLDAPGASLVYSTYLGGSGGDFGQALAVDDAGGAHVAGSTGSVDFPTSNAFQDTFAAAASPLGTNAFVAQLSGSGSSLVYSSYLGGSVGDSAEGIALGRQGVVYVTGYTVSPDFPVVDPEQPSLASQDGDNAFLAAIGDAPRLGDAAVDARTRAKDAASDAGGLEDASFEDSPDEEAPEASTILAVKGARGSGCACRIGGGSRSATGAWTAWVAVVVALARRRRARSVIAFGGREP